MLNFLKRLLTPPVFPGDETRTQQAYLLNIILWGLTVVAVAALPLAPQPAIVGLVANVFLLILLKLRFVRTASLIQIFVFWITFTNLAYSGSGVAGPAYLLGFGIVIVIAGVLFGGWGAAAMTLLSLLTGGYIVYAETSGLKTFVSAGNSAAVFPYSLIMFPMGALLQYLAARATQQALQRARKSELELKEKNEALQVFSEGLEKLVNERTSDLATATLQMTRRASQLQAVSEVARAIATIQDIETLLPEITRAISRSFDIYHAGIFLIDEQRRFAVLSAANSEGGQRMLSRAHKLEIGRIGIVGNVAATGLPRVALDTGADAIYFNNPDLPETHSEMALPLKIGSEIIGVLDVQSRETNAFSPEDVDVLSTLANQVTIAIQNARLFGQTRQALEEAEAAFQRYITEGWQEYSQGLATTGVVIKNARINPLEGEFAQAANKEVLATGAVAIEHGPQPVLAIPIKVRGTMIGVMNVRGANASRSWSSDEVTAAQTIADRVAGALENARLVEETRERAARERALSEMSNRIGASIDMDNILTTAVRELGRLVPDSDVVIQLGRNSAEKS